MSDRWTVRKATAWTTEFLEGKGVDAPRTDADLLLADALGVDRIRLIIDSDKPLGVEELASYRQRIERRAAGEPLAYILGRREFHGHDFLVDSRVLIPRPETEGLVEIALRSQKPPRRREEEPTPSEEGEMQPGQEAGEAPPAPKPEPKPDEPPKTLRFLDLCAGSGCLGITIALESATARVDLVEIDPGAAAVARSNIEKHGVGDRVRLFVGDLFAPVEGEPPYDCIVSNPPYIPSAEIPGLSREVRREPGLALDGGPDGLDLVRRIAAEAGRFLVPGGLIALELTIEQPPEAATLFRAAGFSAATVEQDFTRRDRYMLARR